MYFTWLCCHPKASTLLPAYRGMRSWTTGGTSLRSFRWAVHMNHYQETILVSRLGLVDLKILKMQGLKDFWRYMKKYSKYWIYTPFCFLLSMDFLWKKQWISFEKKPAVTIDKRRCAASGRSWFWVWPRVALEPFAMPWTSWGSAPITARKLSCLRAEQAWSKRGRLEWVGCRTSEVLY